MPASNPPNGSAAAGARVRGAAGRGATARWAVAASVVAGILVCFGGSGGARAQALRDEARDAEQGGTFVLDPIVVTATRLPEPLRDVPAALSVVEAPDIQKAQPTVGLEESLARVPGVLVQNNRNFAQDARLQIRGFGTRAAFGIREIRILVDGLPLTLADGQTEIDDLDLGVADHIEVLRAPASSLYGNASGGVIQVFTEDPPDTPEVATRLEGGSYGFQKYLVKGGARAGPVGFLLSGSFTDLAGYRDHAAARRAIANGKLRWAPDDDTDVTLLLSGVDTPTADDPGGLTRAEVRADRRQARALNRTLDAGEHVTQGRLGVVGRHHIGPGDLMGYGYVVGRDFEGRLPIPPDAGDGITALRRVSPGGGVRYAFEEPVLGWRQTLLVGVDVQSQHDVRRRFANEAGRRGPLGLDQDEDVTSVGPYLRETVFVRDDLEASVGLRYDAVRFAVDVHTPADSGGSGSRTLTAWSPAGGVRWSPRPWASLFANVGTAFQVPTTTELARPEGVGFNPDVQPQQAVSYELGTRVRQGGWLEAGLTGFLVDIDDELVVFEGPSGRNFFRNAGRSRRFGFEADWTVVPLPGIRWSAAITHIDAEYQRYRTPAGSFDGNDEPGIPAWTVYDELEVRHPSGLYAAIEGLFVEQFFVDDANTAHNGSYQVINLRAGYDGWRGGIRIEPYIGIANVTDTAYNGTVRLNAAGGRFFEPAPGVNAYGGVVVSAQF